MERALFFPNHTGDGCSDSWYKPDSGCLRCKALRRDLDNTMLELTKRLMQNNLQTSYAGPTKLTNPP